MVLTSGYVGPACAVVDGNLYVHGLHIRALNSSEISQFESYQDALDRVKKAQANPSRYHNGLILCNIVKI